MAHNLKASESPQCGQKHGIAQFGAAGQVQHHPSRIDLHQESKARCLVKAGEKNHPCWLGITFLLRHFVDCAL